MFVKNVFLFTFLMKLFFFTFLAKHFVFLAQIYFLAKTCFYLGKVHLVILIWRTLFGKTSFGELHLVKLPLAKLHLAKLIWRRLATPIHSLAWPGSTLATPVALIFSNGWTDRQTDKQTHTCSIIL